MNYLTKQERNVLYLVLFLLVAGMAVKWYRVAHPPVAVARQPKP